MFRIIVFFIQKYVIFIENIFKAEKKTWTRIDYN